jgi:hypothetical protein
MPRDTQPDREAMLHHLCTSAQLVEEYESTWEDEWLAFNKEFNTNLTIDCFLEVALQAAGRAERNREREVEVKGLGPDYWETCGCEECERKMPVVDIVC